MDHSQRATPAQPNALASNRLDLAPTFHPRRFTAIKCLVGAGLFTLIASATRAGPPTKGSYSTMAPLGQYLMPHDAEIALARSAGPEAVTKDAEVLLLGPDGFKVEVAGHNGFVCVVTRSWSSPIDDPEFWNPHERGPICYNPDAARYCVPLLLRKTELALAGKSKSEITDEIRADLSAGKFPPLGAGAMCYMISKGGHLNDVAGHWHPHLMFFVPAEQPSAWGANLTGSPVFASTDDLDHVTIFIVPVGQWSDGSMDSH